MAMTSDLPPSDCGKRLLPVLVDDISRSGPQRVFASVARSVNLHDGFRDITYKEFASAIDRCAWWIERELGKGQNFETIGYMGPLDFRCPILLLAAVKTGYKVMSIHPV